jgi:hypothetical protein
MTFPFVVGSAAYGQFASRFALLSTRPKVTNVYFPRDPAAQLRRAGGECGSRPR